MIDRRLMQYSAAVGALAASGPLLAEPQPISPVFLEGTEVAPGVFSINGSIDVTGDGTAEMNVFGTFNYNNNDGYVFLSGTPGNYIARTFVSGGYVAQAFAPDDEVDGTHSSWNDLTYLFSRNWSEPPDGDFETFLNERGFVGLRFQLPETGTVYGCMETRLVLSGGLDLAVRGGLYEDVAGEPVTCPEFVDEVFSDRFSVD